MLSIKFSGFWKDAIFCFLLGGGSLLTSLETEAAQHGVRTTSVRPATVRPQAVRPQAVRPQAVRPQAVRPQAVRPQAVRPQAVRPQAVRPQAVRPQAVRPQAVRPNGVRPNTVRPNGVRPNGVKPQPVQPNKVRPNVVQPKGVRPNTVKPAFSPLGGGFAPSDDGVAVQSVPQGSQAESLGLEPGDTILSINGQSLSASDTNNDPVGALNSELANTSPSNRGTGTATLVIRDTNTGLTWQVKVPVD